MELGGLNLTTFFSCPKPLTSATKYRPLLTSHRILYVPSHHHRRISVITSAANFICPTSPTVIIENDKNNNSSCGNSLSANHYPYLPSHNEVPGDGVDSNSQFDHSADSVSYYYLQMNCCSI